MERRWAAGRNCARAGLLLVHLSRELAKIPGPQHLSLFVPSPSLLLSSPHLVADRRIRLHLVVFLARCPNFQRPACEALSTPFWPSPLFTRREARRGTSSRPSSSRSVLRTTTPSETSGEQQIFFFTGGRRAGWEPGPRGRRASEVEEGTEGTSELAAPMLILLPCLLLRPDSLEPSSSPTFPDPECRSAFSPMPPISTEPSRSSSSVSPPRLLPFPRRPFLRADPFTSLAYV